MLLAGHCTSLISETDIKAKAFRDIVSAMAQAGQYHQARKLANLISDAETKADALGDIASAMADEKGFREAYKVIKDMEDVYAAKSIALVHLLKVWRQRDKK